MMRALLIYLSQSKLLAKLVTGNPEGDWKPRAAALKYKLEQGIIIYGSDAD